MAGTGALPGTNNGGGPKTPDGRARALAQLGYPPGLAHITHGATMAAGNLMPCDKCLKQNDCEAHQAGERCQLEAAYLAERRGQLGQITHLEAIDGPAVDALVWTEIRLQRLARALSVYGEFVTGPRKGQVSLQPIAAQADKLLTTWTRQLQGLGLTPGERRKLAASDGGPAAKIAEALEALADRDRPQAKAEAVDADFQAEDVPETHQSHEASPGGDGTG